MKITKLLPVIVVVVSLLLSACSSLGFTAKAITVATQSIKQSVPANTSSASNSLAQSIPVSAPPVNKAASVNPQTVAGLAALQNEYEAIYQNVNPSVVTIQISSQVPTSTSGSRNFGGQGNGQGSQGQIAPTAEGSGFIWDTKGDIVTNNHVVDGAAKISVTFSDNSSYDAKLVGTDLNSDLAVIQVTNAPASLFKPITVGDSTQVKVGELVVAIGNPFGLANTMTTGIVSAIGRSIQAGAGNSQNSTSNIPSFSIPDIIQTDAAINPGNSGGVLVDINGALIGVPSQIESAGGSNSGIGFAIPSAIVSKVIPQLISKGSAAHSYLGISGSTLSTDLVSALNLKTGLQGILVASVVTGGPADKAGLKGAVVDANGSPTAAGDIITGIDGKTIVRFEDLVSYLSNSTQPGQVVTLNVLRAGKEIQIKVTLGTQPTK